MDESFMENYEVPYSGPLNPQLVKNPICFDVMFNNPLGIKSWNAIENDMAKFMIGLLFDVVNNGKSSFRAEPVSISMCGLS